MSSKKCPKRKYLDISQKENGKKNIEVEQGFVL